MYIDGATCTWAGKWSGKPSVAPPGNMSDHCQDYSRINHVRGRERILYFPFIFSVITYSTSKVKSVILQEEFKYFVFCKFWFGL